MLLTKIVYIHSHIHFKINEQEGYRNWHVTSDFGLTSIADETMTHNTITNLSWSKKLPSDQTSQPMNLVSTSNMQNNSINTASHTLVHLIT